MTDPWKRKEVIGDCTLYLGDCLEVMPTLAPVDAVVTDPPYGIGDSPILGQGRTGRRTGAVNTWHPESTWDHGISTLWGPLCCDVADIICWFGQWRKREEVSQTIRWPLRAEIIWAKNCHVGAPNPLAPRDERIWVFSKNGLKPNVFETSVWDEPIIPTWSYRHHKNEKPEHLMSRLVSWSGADIVMDPFMGSGTTGVACVKLGRKFIGIELEESYFDIACKRIEKAYAQPDMFIEQEKAPKPIQEELLEAGE